MKKVFQSVSGLAALLLTASVLFTSCDKDDDGGDDYQQPVVNATVFSAASDSAGIVAKLTDFRNTIGATLNTAPGATGGRREVNWDAVPPTFTNNNNFPGDFFGQTDAALPNGRKRGLIMEAPGGLFRVDSTSFADLRSSYAAQFINFSPKRLFMTIGGNQTVCTFRVPGTATAASVKGFGVIFSDVDEDNSATIEFFSGDKSLGVYKAPKGTIAQRSFSFLGVHFPDDKITKVIIRSGKGNLGGIDDISTSGGTADLVTMDDFLYSEPVAL